MPTDRLYDLRYDRYITGQWTIATMMVWRLQPLLTSFNYRTPPHHRLPLVSAWLGGLFTGIPMNLCWGYSKWETQGQIQFDSDQKTSTVFYKSKGLQQIHSCNTGLILPNKYSSPWGSYVLNHVPHKIHMLKSPKSQYLKNVTMFEDSIFRMWLSWNDAIRWGLNLVRLVSY